MSLTFDDIQKTIDLLGPSPTPHPPIYVSKDLAASIKEASFPIDRISGIELHITDLLPFKHKYGVCDVATRMEHFMEGEEVHAVMMPAIDPFKVEHRPSMEFAWQQQRDLIDSWRDLIIFK